MRDRLKPALDAVHAEEELKERTLAFLRDRREERAPRRRVGKPALAAACLAVLLLCVGGGFCFVPTSVVSVDINPSIQLEVNRFDRVIRVREYNESGRELAQELKLWYLDCGEAVERILESGEISSLLAEDGQMEITVAGRAAQCSRLLEEMEACAAGHGNVRCYRAEAEDIQNAQSLGLSMGKYRALLDLQALDPQITAEDIRDLTMAQIRQLERELSGSGEPGGHGQGHGGGGGNGCGRGWE